MISYSGRPIGTRYEIVHGQWSVNFKLVSVYGTYIFIFIVMLRLQGHATICARFFRANPKMASRYEDMDMVAVADSKYLSLIINRKMSLYILSNHINTLWWSVVSDSQWQWRRRRRHICSVKSWSSSDTMRGEKLLKLPYHQNPYCHIIKIINIPADDWPAVLLLFFLSGEIDFGRFLRAYGLLCWMGWCSTRIYNNLHCTSHKASIRPYKIPFPCSASFLPPSSAATNAHSVPWISMAGRKRKRGGNPFIFCNQSLPLNPRLPTARENACNQITLCRSIKYMNPSFNYERQQRKRHGLPWGHYCGRSVGRSVGPWQAVTGNERKNSNQLNDTDGRRRRRRCLLALLNSWSFAHAVRRSNFGPLLWETFQR